VVSGDRSRLEQVELPPFAAAIHAGVRLVMAAHLSVPALDGVADRPATLSPAILQDLLRGGLGFQGVVISDALDMAAFSEGDALMVDCITAAAAGIDLLLLNHPLPESARVAAGLLRASRRGLLAPESVAASAGRVLALKAWLAQQEQPPLDVVGCAAHLELALEVARRSVTLVRDTAHMLPLRLPETARLGVVLPQPQDLTPADTSSYLKPALAAELRKFHAQVDEFTLPIDPSPAEIAALRAKAGEYAVLIIGTLNAPGFPGQMALVNTLLATGVPCLLVALRMPYDLAAFPQAAACACTYSLQPPSMQALAEALFGAQPWRGRLPVLLPGLPAALPGLPAALPGLPAALPGLPAAEQTQ
jgi:beta-N-acetylhexosaminidase